MSSDDEPTNMDLVISDNEIEDDDIVEVGDNVEAEGVQGNTEEVERDAGGEDGNEEGGDRVPVKPKRVVRNPQPRLNAERLKGPRGLGAIESYFERVKFMGKGNEDRDLNSIMKTYEYWCHRLFPKYPFDTCIATLEKLGHKRPVQTHIKRIRFDLLIEDKPIMDSSDDETNVDGFVDIQEEQIKQHNMQFDQLLGNSLPQSNQAATLTDEQLERIRLNKEKADQLRQERLKKIQQKAQGNLDISSQIPGTSGLEHPPIEDNYDDQSDTMSQEVSRNAFDDVEFNHESNVKGKNIVRGSTIKKSGKKIANNAESDLKRNAREVNKPLDSDEEDNLVIDELQVDENVNNEVTSKSVYNNNAIQSDQGNEESVDQTKHTLTDGLITKNKRKNVVDSDESGQDMEGISQPSNNIINVDSTKTDEDMNHTKQVDAMTINKKNENVDKTIIYSDQTKNKRKNVIDSDESYQDMEGISQTSNNMTNGDSAEPVDSINNNKKNENVDKSVIDSVDSDQNMEEIHQESSSTLDNNESELNGGLKPMLPVKTIQAMENMGHKHKSISNSGESDQDMDKTDENSIKKGDYEKMETAIIESMEVEEEQDSVFKSTDLETDKCSVNNVLLSENKENASTDSFS